MQKTKVLQITARTRAGGVVTIVTFQDGALQLREAALHHIDVFTAGITRAMSAQHPNFLRHTTCSQKFNFLQIILWKNRNKYLNIQSDCDLNCRRRDRVSWYQDDYR